MQGYIEVKILLKVDTAKGETFILTESEMKGRTRRSRGKCIKPIDRPGEREVAKERMPRKAIGLGIYQHHK